MLLLSLVLLSTYLFFLSLSAATGNARFEKQFWEVLAIRNGKQPLIQFYEKLDNRTQQQVDTSAQQLELTLQLQIIIFIINVSVISLLIIIARRYYINQVRMLNKKVAKRTEALSNSNHSLKKALDDIKTLISHGICPDCEAKIRSESGLVK